MGNSEAFHPEVDYLLGTTEPFRKQLHVRDTGPPPLIQRYVLIDIFCEYINEQHSHCPTVELQGLMGQVVPADTWKNRNQTFSLTSSKRTSHSTLYKSLASSLATRLPSDSLSLRLSLLSPPSPFSPVSRIGGESNYISVGLAVWR